MSQTRRDDEATADLVLTAAEVGPVVAALEVGHTLTARQVRYLTRQGCLGRAGTGTQGHTRVYDEPDMTLLRLVVRLRRQGVPLWTAKAVLVYVGDAVRTAMLHPHGRGLVLEGMRARLVPIAELPAAGYGVVDLRTLTPGLRTHMARRRTEAPAVWRFGWRPPHEAAAAARTQVTGDCVTV